VEGEMFRLSIVCPYRLTALFSGHLFTDDVTPISSHNVLFISMFSLVT
jgi:hypothetical protein